MPRPIDHLVLPVTTLALARSRLTSLGFTVAPDARHPFGTGNCCVFFRNGTYLEPITFVDGDAAAAAAAAGLIFVTALKRFAERRGEGFAMLALRSEDAEGDARELAEAGVGADPVFRFSRTATLPDGSEQEIGVVLAYAAHPQVPDATLFLCQKINAEALWNEAYVSHPNGTEGVSAVTAVASDPSAFRGLLSAATGSSDPQQISGDIQVISDGTLVSVVTPKTFASRYGVDAPDPGEGLVFAALDLRVSDLDRAIGYAGATAMRRGERIIVPPSAGLKTVLAFGTDNNG